MVLSALLLFWLWHDIKRSNRYRRTLERVMLQREHLLLTISHDIKAPVNSILGYLNLLPQKQVQQSKELSAISTSAQYLLHLVKALVEYYKLENEDVEIHSKPTNLYKLLHEIITISNRLPNKKISNLHATLNKQNMCWWTMLFNYAKLSKIFEQCYKIYHKRRSSPMFSCPPRWTFMYSCTRHWLWYVQSRHRTHFPTLHTR